MMLLNPGDAMGKSIAEWAKGDRDAARYWLDIARELRAGWSDRSRGYTNTPPVEHEPAEPLGLTPQQRRQSDITELIDAVRPADDLCLACGRELIAGPGGIVVHRTSYLVGCDEAYSAPFATSTATSQ